MQLRLRPMAPTDAATLASWAVDPVFRAHAGWSESMSIDELDAWWVATIETPASHLVRLSAVVGDELVGYVDLHGDEEDTRELGFLIGPSTRWGRGWGTAAAWAGLEYGFGALGLASIWAEALEGNAASVRVLRRIGMTYTGRGSEDWFLGNRSAYAQFVLTRQDWIQGHTPPTRGPLATETPSTS